MSDSNDNPNEYSRQFFKNHRERTEKAGDLLREALEALDHTLPPQSGYNHDSHNLALSNIALAKMKASQLLMSGEYVRFIEND